jgi:predicted flap endonuclease-1-like 5' DNA nuclease
MTDNAERAACARTCWIMGAIGGLVCAFLLLVLFGWSFFAALFGGIVGAIILGYLLIKYRCTGSGPAVSAPPPAQTDATKAAGGTAPSAAGGTAVTAPVAAATAHTASAPMPAVTLPPAEPAAAVEKTAAPAKAKAAAKPKASAKPKAAAKPAAAPKAAAKTAPAKPKRAAVATDGKPELLDAPRATGADDLKLISGVGPKLEQTLNELGIWHFDQLAGLRKKEITWVDDRLRFKGRIERDGWINQAKILAKGGETEFSKRKKK